MRRILAATVLCVGVAVPGASFAESDGCKAPRGWEAVADRAEGRVLFFTDDHGSNETPDAFYRYVCTVSARPGRTVVALEINAHHAGAIEAAITADAPEEVLLERMEQHWRSPDGRGSEAAYRLLLRLIDLRKAGADLHIVPIQGLAGLPEFNSAEEMQAWFAERDQTELQLMVSRGKAQRIAAAREGAARTLVLVGHYHARKARDENFPLLVFAAMQTPDALSIYQTQDGGTSWFLRPGDNVPGAYSNGPSPVRPGPDLLAETDMGWFEDLKPAFDGYYHVGPLSPSPPLLWDKEDD